jgi:hypothetical protein
MMISKAMIDKLPIHPFHTLGELLFHHPIQGVNKEKEKENKEASE